jgi:hypothetical protein
MAHFSQDEALLKVLNSGTDVFKQMACQWKQLSFDQVSTNDREQCKSLAYGILYGMGPTSIKEVTFGRCLLLIVEGIESTVRRTCHRDNGQL